MVRFEVRGRGATTIEAYQAAQVMAARFTEGDTGWYETDEDYTLDLGNPVGPVSQAVAEGKLVVCTLTLSRVETHGEQRDAGLEPI